MSNPRSSKRNPRSDKQGLQGLLGDHAVAFWTVVSGIVAVITVVVTLVTLSAGKPSPNPPITPSPSSTGSNPINLVQSGAAEGTTATLQPTHAGDALIIVAMPYGTGPGQEVTGVTRNGGDTFQEIAHENDGRDDSVSIWADFHCAGGQAAVTIDTSSTKASMSEIYYYEFSGVSRPDQSSTGATGRTSATFSSGTTPATTVSNEAWVGGVSNYESYETLPGAQWNNFTDRPFFAAGYQIVTSTGQALYSGTQVKGYSAAAVVTLAGP